MNYAVVITDLPEDAATGRFREDIVIAGFATHGAAFGWADKQKRAFFIAPVYTRTGAHDRVKRARRVRSRRV